MTKHTQITQFNNDNVREINAEVKAALDAIAAKYGLTVEPKGRSYRRDSLPVLFQFVPSPSNAHASLAAKQAAFKSAAWVFGFEPSDFGREFTARGQTFRIDALKTKSPRYPVIAIDVDSGKSYKFSAEDAKMYMGITPKQATPPFSASDLEQPYQRGA